jgi:glycine cleavage system regulatory protein
MEQRLVMTVIGSDRPGLVDKVAAVVAEHEGNWLESRMSRLGGQFAGILRVELPAENQKAAIAALEGLKGQGLTVVIHTDQTETASQAHRLAWLEIVGQDRPGIVHQISRALADQKVNVEELQTECASAAMSGESIFKARARLGIPPSCDVEAIRKQLEKIAEDLIVEVNFSERPLDQPATA